jgi:hypothetical protein
MLPNECPPTNELVNNADQYALGQWRRWPAGGLGYQRLQAEDIPGSDARVGMTRSIRDHMSRVQAQHKNAQGPD